MTARIMTQPFGASINPTNPWVSGFADAYGAELLQAGILDAGSIDRARRAAIATGDRFDLVLTKLGLVSEADLAASLAGFLGVALYSPNDEGLEPLMDDILAPSFIRQNRMLPIRMDDRRITIAVVDPFDTLPLEATRLVVDRPIEYEIVTQSNFDRLIQSIYPNDDPGSQSAIQVQSNDDASEFDLQRLQESASEAPVVRLVSKIISDAVYLRASDIHFEPTTNSLNVRYRIDGMLRTVETIPESLRAAVVSRVKILAKKDIAERRLPQDGRIKLAVRGDEIDFRIATIPTVNGESIVMRVLDRNRVQLDFEHLGFDDAHVALLQRLMAYPNGIVLVTGPTGSGKTTTLYTILKRLNQPFSKIFTVEDPIEYLLAGISQVQVQQAIGLDFPACLRAILRQDPDMIMIGEIRDRETAHIAVQASLTGHLVFSTLHTNSAAETVTRLMDMGVEHFLLGSTIRGIVGQRLVRSLCPACTRPHEKSSYWVDCLGDRMPSQLKRPPPNLCQPVGCPKCHSTGFRGRLAISEVLLIDESIQQAILRRLPASEIASIARQGGMTTIYEDGVAKAWDGSTTIEEVLRVTSIV
jgi:general secretion pathway protein E